MGMQPKMEEKTRVRNWGTSAKNWGRKVAPDSECRFGGIEALDCETDTQTDRETETDKHEHTMSEHFATVHKLFKTDITHVEIRAPRRLNQHNTHVQSPTATAIPGSISQSQENFLILQSEVQTYVTLGSRFWY